MDLTWPDDLPSRIDALLHDVEGREGSPASISVTLLQLSDEYEAVAVLSGRTTRSGGRTPEEAMMNARFLALRRAHIGDMAVCGLLLETEVLRATLRPDGAAPDRYRLTIEPLMLGWKGWRTVTMTVTMDPPSSNGRRYMYVHGLRGKFDSDARWVRDQIEGRIAKTGTLRLHTLILALAGEDMRGRQGHHVNRFAGDNRIGNLRSMTEAEHRAVHSQFLEKLAFPGWAPDGGASTPSAEVGELVSQHLPIFASARANGSGTSPSGSFASPTLAAIERQIRRISGRSDFQRNARALLDVLWRHPDGMRHQDLVDALSLAESGVRKLSLRLQQAGLVERWPSGRDTLVRAAIRPRGRTSR